MVVGMRGRLGAAAARRVVEESSRDRESVKGLSLVESLAPVKRESRSVATKRDALVSNSFTMQRDYHTAIQFSMEKDD